MWARARFARRGGGAARGLRIHQEWSDSPALVKGSERDGSNMRKFGDAVISHATAADSAHVGAGETCPRLGHPLGVGKALEVGPHLQAGNAAIGTRGSPRARTRAGRRSPSSWAARIGFERIIDESGGAAPEATASADDENRTFNTGADAYCRCRTRPYRRSREALQGADGGRL